MSPLEPVLPPDMDDVDFLHTFQTLLEIKVKPDPTHVYPDSDLISLGHFVTRYGPRLLSMARAGLPQPAAATALPRWVVTYTRIPTRFNWPNSAFVAAATAEDAKTLMKHKLCDLGSPRIYSYTVKPYEPPPPGAVVRDSGAA